MTSGNRLVPLLALTFCALAVNVRAQTPQLNSVNITPESGRVRVNAVGTVFDLKIEVLDDAGDIVFEGAQPVAGQPLDWNMKSARGTRVSAGTYTVTVSYTTESGKPRKRVEQIVVTEEVTSGDATVGTVAGSRTASPAPTASAPEGPTPLVDGSGIINRITKFADGDTLTSSSIIDLAGRIGIGTLNPRTGWRMEVVGSSLFRPGGAGGEMQLSTPNGETGMVILGSNRADLRFNGQVLKLVAGAGTATPPPTNGLAITTAGNVGIGTIAPTARLEVNSSTTHAILGKSSGAYAGVYGESTGFNGVRGVGRNVNHGAVVGVHTASGFAVYGTSSGPGVVGDSTGAAGVVGRTTVGNSSVGGVYGTAMTAGGVGVKGEANALTSIGVYANNPTGMALKVAGNATQTRDKGGLIKAMIYVDPFLPASQYIVRCFNSQGASNATTTAPCGFTVTRDSEGYYRINFGFDVSTRFYSLTLRSGNPLLRAGTIGPGDTVNQLRIETFNTPDSDSDSANAYIDAAFYLIVY